MDRTNLKERRTASRAPLSLPVHLRILGAVAEKSSRTCDVSSAGIFVATDSPYSAGTKVEAELDLPSVDMRVRARGLVVRSVTEESEADGPAGMAIQFTEHDEVGWRFLIDLVESYR